MLKRIKINTAMLICFAFIFRLLLINLSTVAAQTTHTHKSALKSYSSLVVKRAKHFDVANHLFGTQNASIECCEEEANGDEKLKSPFFTQFLDWFIGYPINNILKQSYNCYQSFCYSTSHRYLALQVIRI